MWHHHFFPTNILGLSGTTNSNAKVPRILGSKTRRDPVVDRSRRCRHSHDRLHESNLLGVFRSGWKLRKIWRTKESGDVWNVCLFGVMLSFEVFNWNCFFFRGGLSWHDSWNDACCGFIYCFAVIALMYLTIIKRNNSQDICLPMSSDFWMYVKHDEVFHLSAAMSN